MGIDWDKIKWFRKSEVDCPCCGCSDIEESIILKADNIRDIYGMVRVNSGVRCPKHNHEVGGAWQSSHIAMPAREILGQALDLAPVKFSNEKHGLDFQGEVDKLYHVSCDVLGDSGGCIREPTWVHIDSRKVKFRQIKNG